MSDIDKEITELLTEARPKRKSPTNKSKAKSSGRNSTSLSISAQGDVHVHSVNNTQQNERRRNRNLRGNQKTYRENVGHPKQQPSVAITERNGAGDRRVELRRGLDKIDFIMYRAIQVLGFITIIGWTFFLEL